VAWNTTLAARQRKAAAVRLELHPFDADHRNVRECWQRLAQIQSQTRQAETLRALASSLRSQATYSKA
jgi:predicted deacetylase